MLLTLFSAGAGWCAPVGAAGYFVRTWTTEEGLPHNVVTHLLQDREGYIWVATPGGLARFDGREFKSFELPANMRTQGFSIRGLAEDTDSSLLLLLPGGNLVRLNRGVFTLHPFTSTLRGKSTLDLFVEPGGAVWVGTGDGVLYRWEKGRTSSFGKGDGIVLRSPAFSFAADRRGRIWIASGDFFGHFEKGELIPYGQRLGNKLAIAPAASGGIWILANSRLIKLDDDRLTVVPSSPARLPSNSLTRQVFEGRDGAVWIATRRQGFFRYEGGELNHVAAIGDFTLVGAVDREGNIWTGTEGSGLSMLRPKFFSLIGGESASPQPPGLGIGVGAVGDAWFGGHPGGAMRYFEGHLEPIRGLGEIHVNTVCPDARGRTWIGASDGIYLLPTGADETPRKIEPCAMDVRTLFCDRGGDLWFADLAGSLGMVRGDKCEFFSERDGYSPGRMISIAQDASGTIWIGGEKGVIWQFAQGRFTTLPWPAEIPVAPIQALHVDSRGHLWIGTADGLLLREGTHLKRFTKADGLPDTMIFQIQEDETGHLWFGSRLGIFCVRIESLEAVAAGGAGPVDAMMLGRQDGLPPLSPLTGRQPLSWKSSSGDVYLTTQQGVVALNPSRISFPGRYPPVVIEDALLDGRSQDLSRPMTVPSGRHRLEFQFAVLSFAGADRIRLRHQLDGIDPGWVETDRSQTAGYSSLPPGAYRLHVKAEPAEEKGSSTTVLEFSVAEAWWQTTWAKTAAIAILAIAFAGVARANANWQLKRQLERLEHAHALENERARIARDLHDELGGSLTQISFGVDQLSCRISSPESAQLLDQLSQRVRRHTRDLQRIIWVENPKNDSLDRVFGFISRFADEYFSDSVVACHVSMVDPIPAGRIQPEVQHNLVAIAKEAFNNVLKHSKARQVVVEGRFQNSVFELTIADNGAGFTPHGGVDYDHNGLSNMRTRAAEIGGRLQILTRPGAGTTVTVHWPYRPRPSAGTEASRAG